MKIILWWEVTTWGTVLGVAVLGRLKPRSVVSGAWCIWSHSNCGQDAGRDKCWCVPLFIQHSIRAHGLELPTFREDGNPVKPPWSHLYWHTPCCVSQAILSAVKLLMKNDHHHPCIQAALRHAVTHHFVCSFLCLSSTFLSMPILCRQSLKFL